MTSLPVPSGASALIMTLQDRLHRRSNLKTRVWWEAYLKGNAVFRGVTMGVIREELHAWYHEQRLPTELTPHELAGLALGLFRETPTEDKLAGILLLQEVVLPAGQVQWSLIVDALGLIFEDAHISDWNVCDWLCVKVLGPLIKKHGPDCARAIAKWKDADGLWQRRASAVAFVELAKRGEINFPGFTTLVLSVCEANAAHVERFSQTGAGWVLRELSVIEPERVTAFVETQLPNLSREALRSAIRKLPEAERDRLLKMRRVALQAG